MFSELDLNALLEFMALKGECTKEEAHAYIKAENEYLMAKDAWVEVPLTKEEERPGDDSVILEQDKIETYVSERTGFDKEKTKKIAIAELYWLIIENSSLEEPFEQFDAEMRGQGWPGGISAIENHSEVVDNDSTTRKETKTWK